MLKNIKILDCTLRDGGYYTNWDFNDETVESYCENLNQLPIDFIEIGYRNKEQNNYYGQFFYSPIATLEKIKRLTSKDLGIILNEKDIIAGDLDLLLKPIKNYVSLIRLAIDPKNIGSAKNLAFTIKEMGFKVAFNIMYMSKWETETNFFEDLKGIENCADYIYMVDSFGGIYPEDVARITKHLKTLTTCTLGFHGHNNLELALINTLTAIENGVEIIDSTITGMGRGAGNLKTELLLSALNAKFNLNVDFNALSKVVSCFNNLKQHYQWGTELPYMVSGANSLPQKEVMEWMIKRYYSLNSIILALTNKSKGIEDNIKLDVFEDFDVLGEEVLLVGGGNSLKEHCAGLKNFLRENKNLTVIHSSSKNAMLLSDFSNPQIFCLLGNEGHRLETVFDDLSEVNGICVLPPFPREMGTYLPSELKNSSFELSKNTAIYKSISQTAMALEIAISAKARTIYIIGFDGYTGSNISQKDQELFIENNFLFNEAKNRGIELISLTPTKYKALQQKSIYSFLP